ncbi:MAG: hypothetical protein IT427_12725 [Pirellulales bacterium]|nr:hypothetical protein [Pirellulales bacterium]
MASSTFKQYDEESKMHMQNFYHTLSEKDQRRYAAVEAKRLGHGGIEYVAKILGCATKTIRRGIQEIDSLVDDPAAGRVRRPADWR